MKNIKEINTEKQWRAFMNENAVHSYKVIFKHSPYCPVSAYAYRNYSEFAETVNDNKNFSLVLVEVISSKKLSNSIASELNVKHESPQCIVLSPSGSVVLHKSHSQISKEFFENLLIYKGNKNES